MSETRSTCREGRSWPESQHFVSRSPSAMPIRGNEMENAMNLVRVLDCHLIERACSPCQFKLCQLWLSRCRGSPFNTSPRWFGVACNTSTKLTLDMSRLRRSTAVRGEKYACVLRVIEGDGVGDTLITHRKAPRPSSLLLVHIKAIRKAKASCRP